MVKSLFKQVGAVLRGRTIRKTAEACGSAGRVSTPKKQSASVSTSAGGNSTEKSGVKRRRRRRKPREAGKNPGTKSGRPVAKAWNRDEFVVEPREGLLRFHDLPLSDELMHAIADLQFEYCTAIQAMTLVPALEGKNVAGRAQTGTGKTAAFLITILARIQKNAAAKDRPCGSPRALIIAPTRELVMQIIKDAENLGRYSGARSLAVFGGTDLDKQRRILANEQIDIIAATPGRLLDFVGRGCLRLKDVEFVVIDEADRMLDMGFIPDVRKIMRCVSPSAKRQTMLFSATLSEPVMRLASQWMPDPVVLETDPEEVAVKSVEQLAYSVTTADKFKVIYNLLKRPEVQRVLIFVNRRDRADRLARRLQQCGETCALLSGDVDQKKRMRVLEQFRCGETRILVATDVAARGLHVEGISHVINADLPYEADDYVHRIGRTGRAGAKGTAISFACEDEAFVLPEIESYIGHAINCVQPEDDLLTPLPPGVGQLKEQPGGGSSRSGGNAGRSRPRPRAGGNRSSFRSRRPRR